MNVKQKAAIARVGLIAATTLGASAWVLAQDLTGAGSTFINPIMQNWISKYRSEAGVSVNYQSIGSGGGISALINKTVDFAGTDAPMSASEMQQAGRPVLHIPVVTGTICIAYNIPGMGGALHMSGPVLADIYLGKVSYWDDPAIKAMNKGVSLPHSKIFVAHRSDGSGSTFILTDYLSKVSSDWASRVGTGKSVHWPVGLGGKGSEGIAGLVRSNPFSIGYVELAYATQNGITYCSMRNAKGKFVAPSSASGSYAAAGVTMPADMRVSITNTSHPNGYPISGFTWLVVYQNPSKSAELKRFLNWVLSKGQDYTSALQYAPIPDAVISRLKAMINSIR